jgi:hypothetical protein
MVPEPALEDNQVIAAMVRAGVITDHFAASVLMVDFTNPVFSPQRSQLLGYVPEQATLDPGGGLSPGSSKP